MAMSYLSSLLLTTYLYSSFLSSFIYILTDHPSVFVISAQNSSFHLKIQKFQVLHSPVYLSIGSFISLLLPISLLKALADLPWAKRLGVNDVKPISVLNDRGTALFLLVGGYMERCCCRKRMNDWSEREWQREEGVNEWGGYEAKTKISRETIKIVKTFCQILKVNMSKKRTVTLGVKRYRKKKEDDEQRARDRG